MSPRTRYVPGVEPNSNTDPSSIEDVAKDVDADFAVSSGTLVSFEVPDTQSSNDVADV